jgi:hypothetical protein
MAALIAMHERDPGPVHRPHEVGVDVVELLDFACGKCPHVGQCRVHHCSCRRWPTYHDYLIGYLRVRLYALSRESGIANMRGDAFAEKLFRTLRRWPHKGVEDVGLKFWIRKYGERAPGVYIQ